MDERPYGPKDNPQCEEADCIRRNTTHNDKVQVVLVSMNG